MKQRYHYDEIDIAKGIGILLVVIGHSINSDSILQTYIYMFHMPLFFIMSGLFIEPEGEKFKLFFRESKLLSYYIFYSIIFLLYAGIFRLMILHEISFGLFKYNVFITCIFYGISVLWFVGALFWAKILVGFIISIIKKNYILLAFLMFVLSDLFKYLIPDIADFGKEQMIKAVILSFARVLCASSFVLVGYWMKQLVFERKHTFQTAVVISVICMIILVCAAFYFNSEGIEFDLHKMYLGKNTSMFWLGIIGFIQVYFVSKFVISRLVFLKKIFLFWGKHSLIIMIFHEYFRIRPLLMKGLIALNVGNERLISTILLILFVSLFAKIYYNFDKMIINKLSKIITGFSLISIRG